MQDATTIRRDAPASLLRNRNFILLWCAYAVSAMGDHLSEMAILKTQNAASLDVDVTPLTARMSFMLFLPFFLLGPFAGLIADRFPRRAIMIAADVARCAVMLGFATLIGWMQDWGKWGPFLPLLLVGTFAALFSPARSALLPTIIRPGQLVRANALISGLGIIATMISLAISGYLADRYAPIIAFRLDGATYLLSGAILLFLAAPQQPRTLSSKASAGTREALVDGFRYVRCHKRVIELLAIAALVWFCGPLVNSVIPAVVRDVYEGSYQDMGFYRVYLGAGFIAGSIIMALLANALRSEIAMTWGLVGISGGIGLFATSVFLPLAPPILARIGAVGIVIAGMCAVAVMASFNSLLQRIVANRYRGRVFGVKDLCCTGALLTATGLLGIPAWTNVDRWVGYILLGVSVVTFVAGMATLRVRLRRGPYGPELAFWENLNEFVVRFWYRLERVGRPTLPREGPVIVTANHTCPADPLFLHAAAPYRPLAFMIAAEYSTFPVIRYMVRLVSCIPVKRDGRDTAATKQAMRHLRDGKALGIFIEGGIVPPGTRPDLKDGVAMLALKTGARVVPAHISGIKYHDAMIRGLLARHRARVRYGPPVDLSDLATGGRENVKQATQRIYDAIIALAPDSEGGIAARSESGRTETDR